MKRIAVLAVLLAAGAALAGFLVAAAGLVSVSAAGGHSAPVSWFLHFTMRRAVRTQSLGIDAPPLDDPGLVERAAGHFHTSCAPCHGAPGQDRAPTLTGTTPPPPELPETIPQWRERELFWIVKHGIKYTGMPSWMARERDDEVWAMVAFLRRLPDMGVEEYRRLAGVDPVPLTEALRRLQPADQRVLESCARCHGADGEGSPAGSIPRLAGQSAGYLRASLDAYALGARPSGIMQPVAEALDAGERQRLADHYAGVDAPSAAADAVSGRGSIIHDGAPAQGVPPCASCHGDRTQGPDDPRYPRLHGQHAAYLAQQLELFRDGRRGGSDYAPLMQFVAKRLTDEQIEAAAAHYADAPDSAP